MKKHWLFTTLAAFALCVICLALFPTEAKAYYSGYYTYDVYYGGATITDCDVSINGDITIPTTLGGYPVTKIGQGAFSECTNLTSITIPDGVTKIGDSAFRDCYNLTEVIIPDSTNAIGAYAFYGCRRLTSITIPDGVTKIDGGAFSDCYNLTDVIIPDSVTSIGGFAFYDCTSLTNITIPDSVTEIGGSAFRGCTSLISITIPDSVTAIGGYAFAGCTNLTGITIPDGVTDIYEGTFRDCSRLTEIVIPNGVTSIGGDTFRNCKNLTIIAIPNSVTFIGHGAFEDCDRLLYLIYCGSEKQWRAITVGLRNEKLTNANRWYHSFVNDVCTICNVSAISFYNAKSGVEIWLIGPANRQTYQWQYSTDGKTWKNCASPSATQAVLVLITKTSYHGNYYRCKTMDANGNTVYSGATRLYILGVTSQPKTQKVKAGEKTKYTVAVTGDGVKYQWQSSTNGESWTDCTSSTAKKATFSFTSKTSHSSNYYRCKVTDSAYNTVYTDAARLYVLGITSQPKTQKVEAGEKVKFTVTATGAGKTYQWQVSTNGKTWKNCSSSSATSATFTFTGKTSHNGNYYRCRIKDSGGNTVYTDAVRLYVLGITEQPVKKTVTKGKTAKFEVEATGASKVYQWQVSTDGGKTWKNCSSSSATKATFTFTSKTTHNGNYYRCRIKDSGGNTVYTAKVKLTVKK